MKLNGSMVSMRRSACLLAIIGMSVQSVVADDFYGSANTRSIPAAAAPGTARVGAVPQKFTRASSSPAAVVRPAQNDELRNYYNELFGADGAPAATSPNAPPMNRPVSNQTFAPSVTGQSGRSMTVGREVVPASASLPSGNPNRVVQATYQSNPENTRPTIQQVGGERISPQDFPGFDEFEPMAAPPRAPEFPAVPTEQAVTPKAAPVPAAPPAKPTGRGSLTFSRSPNSIPPAQSPPAQKLPVLSADVPATPVAPEVPMAASTPVAASATTPAPSAFKSEITTSPSITIEWRKQSDLNIGQECICHLIVKNAGQVSAQNMELQAHFPESVRLINASPAPSTSDQYLGWQMDELKAGEERVIKVVMVPLQSGDINTRAEVRFSGIANGRFAVSEPLLDIHVEGPTQVLIGEAATQTVTVSNPGTGIATAVQIEAMIPQGLEHARGQRLLMELGSLNPGESRSVRLALNALQGGTHNLAIQARAESGLAKSTSSDVVVIAPSIGSAIHGPGLRYLGRQANYTLEVTNNGEAATDNVQMRYKMPTGFDFVSADRGAQFDAATGLITWFVGRLEKGEKSEIKVTLLARQSGEFKHLARATSEHGVISDSELVTTVESTSSLSIQVKDLEDPVEVGSEMVYEIRVKNEGTAAAKAVSLGCEMPAGMSFVSAEGPTEHRGDGHAVAFRSIPEIAAGQTVTYKVKVKAAVSGSLRFRASLMSEGVSEPLSAEEMTKFYGERQ
ncbi:hypothetical protein SH668x_002304 [Planctomicrobium sp. SH668]|uniref:hypothetical protein n=1 Tax=Planctomicrobium sp. SH668 TaxID=3448126 RepID=UPI003F5B8085